MTTSGIELSGRFWDEAVCALDAMAVDGAAALLDPPATRAGVERSPCSIEAEHGQERLVHAPQLFGGELTRPSATSTRVDGAQVLDQHTSKPQTLLA